MGFLLVLITVEYNTTTYKTDIIMNGHFGWCCISMYVFTVMTKLTKKERMKKKQEINLVKDDEY